jgi:hypothetical protein
MSDRIFGGACLLLAAFFIWQATQIKLGFIVDPLGPRAFPIVIGIVLAVAGLYPILRPDPRPDWPAVGGLIEIAFAVAILIAYAMLLPRLGFTHLPQLPPASSPRSASTWSSISCSGCRSPAGPGASRRWKP